jgi:threonine dehydratase
MSEPYVERILKARVYDVAIESALDPMPRLSARLGSQVLLKREDQQPVFSFKLRGAYNKIANLSETVARRGVICASAGNHAQGVALAARRRGIPAVIVMPLTTPAIKVQAVAALGGEVVLHGEIYDAAYEHALKLAAERQLVFVHPFDDPDVIAGQGTIGVEILRQAPGPVDAIFIAVGGGGLIGGVAAYVKYISPKTKIIGVEPEDAAAMHDSLKAGTRVKLDHVGLFADGVAVKRVGEEGFALAQKYVDEMVLVTTDEICAAIQDVFEDTRMVPEPAGALSVAGLKKVVARGGWKDKRLVAINSGANLNFDRLRYIAERADLGAGREALLAVEIPEQPGSFLKFCGVLGARNITEFNYREQGGERAQVFVGLNLSRGAAERGEIVRQLGDAGYRVVDMTDNEMAKLHVRYMIGGQARGLADESVFRFEFPERPGALLRFLEAIGSRWNISMFHYRNHGSDYGRVLAGIQVPAAEREELRLHLGELRYPYVDETANPAYKIFLGN